MTRKKTTPEGHKPCLYFPDGIHRAYTIDFSGKPDSAVVKCECDAWEYMALWFHYSPKGWSRVRFRALKQGVTAFLQSTGIDIGYGRINMDGLVKVTGEKGIFKVVARDIPAGTPDREIASGFNVQPVRVSRKERYSCWVEAGPVRFADAWAIFPVHIRWVIKDDKSYFTPFGQWVSAENGPRIREHAEDHDDYRKAWQKLDYARKLGHAGAKVFRVTVRGPSIGFSDTGDKSPGSADTATT